VEVKAFEFVARLTVMSITYSRRHALWLSAGLLVACRDRKSSAQDASAPAPYGLPPAAAAPVVTDGATPSCIETHANIEGPYYRPGAPLRANLVDPGVSGTPLDIEGRVMGLDCSRGLQNVELDVWHATADGHYDNDGTMHLGRERYLLRGRIRTDADGRYRVSTIVPGRYLNGPQYRPAHVHVKVRAAGFAELTTQLYFPGDPYNDVDPFIHRSLLMGLEKSRERMLGHFDFVLRSA
jgi:protocatechuate 3,4-dioxygenase beta subunit